MLVKFTVDGKAQAKQRPRFMKVGNFVKTYTPKETTNYENWVRICYKQQVGQMAFVEDRPLIVNIIAYYVPPKSWGKAKREQALRNMIVPTNHTDCDNIAKSIMDALNGIAYIDDHYINELHVKKRYGEVEKVDVAIAEVD